MEEKEYQWDISLLNQMKQNLLQSDERNSKSAKKDLRTIEQMISLASGKSEYNVFPITERINIILENMNYCLCKMNTQQFFYFDLLKHTLEKNPIKPEQVDSKPFLIQDVLELFEEFLKWFPSNQLKRFLEIYYEKYFLTHFHYCSNQNMLTSYGITYRFSYFRLPFVAIEKDTFIETFLTLVHEMGHVLFDILEVSYKKEMCNYLFSEMEGMYFEQLALQFLKEKHYDKEAIASASKSYNKMNIYVEKLENPNLIKNIFKEESIKETISEIYSYLGSIELLMRYHGDYEKQLYDLLAILNFQIRSLEQYLKENEFTWREDYFEKIKTYRNQLNHELAHSKNR